MSCLKRLDPKKRIQICGRNLAFETRDHIGSGLWSLLDLRDYQNMCTQSFTDWMGKKSFKRYIVGCGLVVVVMGGAIVIVMVGVILNDVVGMKMVMV